MSLDIVSGALSTVAELEKDEAWLQGWLRERPSRLGLGDLKVADDEPVQDEAGNPAFLAMDDGRCFSVSVRLGEVQAAHGFGVLDSWARNRVRHPDKEHVAVLVTETTGERYRPTLAALAEHLPLVVIELQAWRGEKEAIVVPHVALASGDVDLASSPAAKAAAAVAAAGSGKTSAVPSRPAAAQGAAAAGAAAAGAAAPAAPAAPSVEAASSPMAPRSSGPSQASDAKAAAGTSGGPMAAESSKPASAAATAGAAPADKDDTGIQDPWGPPRKEPQPAASGSGSTGGRLLTKFDT
jgi:hypothetical protein